MRSPAARPLALGPVGFGLWRAALGAYLAVHLGQLIPYAGELYGPNGMLPDPSANLTGAHLPATPWLFASDAHVRGFLAALTLCAVLLTLGVVRRAAAVALWLGLVILLHRNNLTMNVSLPYVGWMLLASALVPRGEGLRVAGLGARGLEVDVGGASGWSFPPALLHGGWLLFGITYTYSGFMKLAQPEWAGGTALAFIAEQPIARGPLVLLHDAGAESLLRAATFAAAGLELACLACLPSRWLRMAVWWGLTVLQLGILASLDLADLTLAVLLFHALLFDPSWIPRRHALAAAAGFRPPLLLLRLRELAQVGPWGPADGPAGRSGHGRPKDQGCESRPRLADSSAGAACRPPIE